MKYKMILFADEKYRKQVRKILKLVDVDLAYEVSEDGADDCCQIYDLLYEDIDKIMVIVAKDDFFKAQKTLSEVGLQMGVNYKNIERFSKESNLLPYYYDPVMGYNLETKEKEESTQSMWHNIKFSKTLTKAHERMYHYNPGKSSAKSLI